MKRNFLIIGVVLAIGLIATIAWTQVSTVNNSLVRTDWPSAEDPGSPFYARTDHVSPFLFNDGEWAAIVFYRDPNCVPADFNLIQFFNPPAAFSCSLTVQGSSLWQGEALSGAPKIVTISEADSVPVWFVPMEAASQATQDGVLTIGELEGLDGLLVGYANQFDETLHPHPLPPELGGGGHPNPKLTIDAHGQMEDGRQFNLHFTQLDDEVHAIQIQFR
jgi:hypothetical protein